MKSDLKRTENDNEMFYLKFTALSMTSLARIQFFIAYLSYKNDV